MEGAKDKSAYALAVAAVSILLAIAGNWLLRGTAWGLNLPLWVLLTGACGFGLLRKSDVTLSRAAKWLAAPILVFSLCFFWRDSDALKVANGIALALAIAVLAERAQRGSPAKASVRDYTLNLALAWLKFTADFAGLVAEDIEWKKGSAGTKQMAGVFRGLLLALPLVILFGGLMTSADAAFNAAVVRMFSFDPGDFFTGFFFVALIAVIVGGLFRRLCWPNRPPVIRETGPASEERPLHLIDYAVTLGAVDLLFVAFVAFQVRYLFGGSGHVAKVAGLTFAEYARSGFFELTAVAALCLPLLLAAQAFARKGEAGFQRWFLVLGSVLTACVFVVLASAFARMQLYVATYGLSELRLFTTLFMGWIAVVLAWLSVSYLLRRPGFSYGALLAGYAFVLAANFINPDALIARTNLGMARSPDLAYLGTLSMDAAPTLESYSRRLPLPERKKLLAQASAHWRGELHGSDWKATNVSRIDYLAADRP